VCITATGGLPGPDLFQAFGYVLITLLWPVILAVLGIAALVAVIAFARGRRDKNSAQGGGFDEEQEIPMQAGEDPRS
jgi:hypothetical protein